MTHAPAAGFLLRLVAEELVEAREAATASSSPPEQLTLLSALLRLLARVGVSPEKVADVFEVSTSGDSTQAGTDSNVEAARPGVRASAVSPSSDWFKMMDLCQNIIIAASARGPLRHPLLRASACVLLTALLEEYGIQTRILTSCESHREECGSRCTCSSIEMIKSQGAFLVANLVMDKPTPQLLDASLRSLLIVNDLIFQGDDDLMVATVSGLHAAIVYCLGDLELAAALTDAMETLSSLVCYEPVCPTLHALAALPDLMLTLRFFGRGESATCAAIASVPVINEYVHYFSERRERDFLRLPDTHVHELMLQWPSIVLILRTALDKVAHERVPETYNVSAMRDSLSTAACARLLTSAGVKVSRTSMLCETAIPHCIRLLFALPCLSRSKIDLFKFGGHSASSLVSSQGDLLVLILIALERGIKEKNGVLAALQLLSIWVHRPHPSASDEVPGCMVSVFIHKIIAPYTPPQGQAKTSWDTVQPMYVAIDLAAHVLELPAFRQQCSGSVPAHIQLNLAELQTVVDATQRVLKVQPRKDRTLLLSPACRFITAFITAFGVPACQQCTSAIATGTNAGKRKVSKQCEERLAVIEQCLALVNVVHSTVQTPHRRDTATQQDGNNLATVVMIQLAKERGLDQAIAHLCRVIPGNVGPELPIWHLPPPPIGAALSRRSACGCDRA